MKKSKKQTNNNTRKQKQNEVHVQKFCEGAQDGVEELHRTFKPTPWRGGMQLTESEEHDVKLEARSNGQVK